MKEMLEYLELNADSITGKGIEREFYFKGGYCNGLCVYQCKDGSFAGFSSSEYSEDGSNFVFNSVDDIQKAIDSI